MGGVGFTGLSEDFFLNWLSDDNVVPGVRFLHIILCTLRHSIMGSVMKSWWFNIQ